MTQQKQQRHVKEKIPGSRVAGGRRARTASNEAEAKLQIPQSESQLPSNDDIAKESHPSKRSFRSKPKVSYSDGPGSSLFSEDSL